LELLTFPHPNSDFRFVKFPAGELEFLQHQLDDALSAENIMTIVKKECGPRAAE